MLPLLVSLLLLLLSTCTVQSDVKCGERKAFSRELISYGNTVSLGKWPWHAAVFHSIDKNWPTYACGGTIVSSSFILTAAHCTYTNSKVRELESTEIEVRVGLTNLQLHEGPSQKRDVSQIIRYPEYYVNSAENDIALLKLATMLNITNYVIPICLDKTNLLQPEIVGKNAIVVGWGQDENGNLADQLKDAIMPIVSRKDCQKSDKNFYTTFLFNSNNFCAGLRNGTSVGKGDSGGGLYLEIDGKWILRGIVSSGKLNNLLNLDTSSYIIFTDVAYYLSWINKNVKFAKMKDYSVCGKLSKSLSNSGTLSIWPWQGRVFRRTISWTRLCDVVVISKSFLLSPANVYTIEDVQRPSRLKVEFINDMGQTSLVRWVKKITTHEDFLIESSENHIAILEMEEAIVHTQPVQPICLETQLSTSNVSGLLDSAERFRAPLLDNQLCSNFSAQSSIPKDQLFCYQVKMQKNFKSPPDFVYSRIRGSWYLRGMTLKTAKTYSPNVLHVRMLDMTYFKDWMKGKMSLLSIQDCDWRNFEDWNLRIFSENKHLCFASPISPSLILTTAVCVDGISLESLSVVKEDGDGKHIKLRKIHLHPMFQNRPVINNIAVLQLEKPFGGIGICLPKIAEDLSDLELRVPTLNEALPTVGFNITDTHNCVRKFHLNRTQIASDESYICGLMVPDNELEFESQCSKDFHGAPLLYATNDDTSVYLRGILDIAKNNHCQDFDTPEVYIDVMRYADWISRVARKSLKQSESDEDDYEYEYADQHESDR